MSSLFKFNPGTKYNPSNVRPKVLFQSFDVKTTEILANLDGLIDSFQIKESLGNAGTIQIKLIHTTNSKVLYDTALSVSRYIDNLKINDVIGIEYAGIPLTTALIDTIRQYERYGNDGIDRGHVIAARDFYAVLIDDQQGALFSSMLKGIEGIDKLKEELGETHPIFLPISVQRAPEPGTFQGQSPIVGLDFILENLVSLRVPIRFKGHTYEAIDFIRLLAFSYEEDILGLFQNTILDGSTLNFIQSAIIDPDYYELFVSTDPKAFSDIKPPGHPVLRLRPRMTNRRDDPFFSDKDWNWEEMKTWVTNEDYHTITNDIILGEDSGISKFDVYSVYRTILTREVVMNNDVYDMGKNLPIIDSVAMKQFGFRLLETTSSMINIDVGKEDFNFDALFKKRDKAFVFNRYNRHYIDGSVTIIGNPYVRIGDRIYFPEKYSHIGKYRGIEAYVTGVSHDYDVNRLNAPKFITKIDYQKGHNLEEYLEYCNETNDKIFKINAIGQ